MTTSLHQGSTSPTRLATAILRLLEASEKAATRGHHKFAKTYAAKAAEASARLHNLTMDTLVEVTRPERVITKVRRTSKAERAHGRIF